MQWRGTWSSRLPARVLQLEVGLCRGIRVRRWTPLGPRRQDGKRIVTWNTPKNEWTSAFKLSTSESCTARHFLLFPSQCHTEPVPVRAKQRLSCDSESESQRWWPFVDDRCWAASWLYQGQVIPGFLANSGFRSKSVLGVATSCRGSFDLPWHVPSLLIPFIKTYLNSTPWLFYTLAMHARCVMWLWNKNLLFFHHDLTMRATYCSARCLAHYRIYKKTLDQEKKKKRQTYGKWIVRKPRPRRTKAQLLHQRHHHRKLRMERLNWSLQWWTKNAVRSPKYFSFSRRKSESRNDLRQHDLWMQKSSQIGKIPIPCVTFLLLISSCENLNPLNVAESAQLI